MKKSFRRIITALILVMTMIVVAMPAYAEGENEATADSPATAQTVSEEATDTSDDAEEDEDNTIGDKAIAAAIVVGLAATAGAIGMGWAIAKSVEGISRQPEAEGKIRTTLMLGLVFVETAIIYALVIAILIIFVL